MDRESIIYFGLAAITPRGLKHLSVQVDKDATHSY